MGSSSVIIAGTDTNLPGNVLYVFGEEVFGFELQNGWLSDSF